MNRYRNGIGALIPIALFSIAGCRMDAVSPSEGHFAPPEALNVDLTRSVTSTLAVTADDRLTMAWTTFGADGEPGRLFAIIGPEGPPIEIRDPDGSPVFDAETPPQVASAGEGDIMLSYPAARDTNDVWESMAIRFVRSDDGGDTWSGPVTVGAGDPFGGYRNDHEMVLGPDGSIYIAWIDSRFGGDQGGKRIVLSRSDDRGLTWSPPASVDPAPSCECCRVALAVDSDGTVVAAWRKIIDERIRDIVTARSTDRGATWSAPARVHADEWQVDYCPDAGPALQFDRENTLHLAWWTGAPGAAGVRYARSTDRGASFEPATEMKLGALSRASHVQLSVAGDRIAVVWEDATLESPQIALRTSADGGRTFGAIQYLSESGQRVAYPQIAFTDARWAVFWHQRGDATAPTRSLDPDGTRWISHSDLDAPQLVRRLSE